MPLHSALEVFLPGCREGLWSPGLEDLGWKPSSPTPVHVDISVLVLQESKTILQEFKEATQERGGRKGWGGHKDVEDSEGRGTRNVALDWSA